MSFVFVKKKKVFLFLSWDKKCSLGRQMMTRRFGRLELSGCECFWHFIGQLVRKTQHRDIFYIHILSYPWLWFFSLLSLLSSAFSNLLSAAFWNLLSSRYSSAFFSHFFVFFIFSFNLWNVRSRSLTRVETPSFEVCFIGRACPLAFIRRGSWCVLFAARWAPVRLSEWRRRKCLEKGKIMSS